MRDIKSEVLTYKNNLSKAELKHVFFAIAIPIGVFSLGIFVISSFANFGSKLICPLSAGMWIVGLIVALLMPSQRKEVINQTMVMCSLYYLAMMGIKILLGLVSGVSSEMIAASFNQVIPTATGNTIVGYLQTMLWITSVAMPIAHVTMQVKRLFQFKKSQTLNKTFGQKRSIRSNGQGNTQMFDRH